MNSVPTVSAIVTTHNGAHWIASTVHSIQKQTRVALEIIVVDDASTDNTVEIVRSIMASDQRVKLIELPTNVGISIARNTAIRASGGRYLVFLDDDDYWEPDALGDLVRVAENCSLQILAFETVSIRDRSASARQWVEQTGIFRQRTSVEITSNGKNVMARLEAKRLYRPMVWLYLFERDYLLRTCLVFTPRVIHEDVSFTFKALYRSARAGYVPIALHRRRVRGASITNSKNLEESVYGQLVAFREVVEVVRNTLSPGNAVPKYVLAIVSRQASKFEKSWWHLDDLAKQRVWTRVARRDSFGLLMALAQRRRVGAKTILRPPAFWVKVMLCYLRRERSEIAAR